MGYWQAVLQEVLHKDDESYRFIYTNLGDYQRQRKELMKRRDQKDPVAKKKEVPKQEYYLGDKYEGVYLTRREAECVICMMQGYTIVQSGELLSLSPRTVEFYIKNIKIKLKCRKKAELLACIKESDFDVAKVMPLLSKPN